MIHLHRPIVSCLILASLWAAAPGAQRLRPRDIDRLPSRDADARISYDTRDPLQFGELRLPKGPGPFPVAIVIHGGCWVSKFATLQNTAALADGLRDAGVATWNVEYRRLDNPGGGWPGTFADVAAAAITFRRSRSSTRWTSRASSQWDIRPVPTSRSGSPPGPGCRPGARCTTRPRSGPAAQLRSAGPVTCATSRPTRRASAEVRLSSNCWAALRSQYRSGTPRHRRLSFCRSVSARS